MRKDISVDDRPSIYFPTLDGLRFFAFLLVFIHHLPRSSIPMLGFLHDQGWVGVHIFFALSAYLLTKILLLECEACGNVSIRKFYLRRCLRLWPLYFVFCTAVYIYVIVSGTWMAGYTGRYIGLIGFVDNVVSGLTWYNPLPWTAHLWTVSVEEQFYLAFPLFLALSMRNPQLLVVRLIAVWGVFIGIRAVCVSFKAAHPLIWTSLFSADALLLGTALGTLNWKPKLSIYTRGVLFVGAISGCFIGGFCPKPDQIGVHQIFIYAVVAIGSALLLVLVIYDPLMSFLAAGPLRYMGKISYGLYVFHFLGIHMAEAFQRHLSIDSWWFHSMAALTITVALASASYRLIEKPFLSFKLKYEAVRNRPI
jgi:peptidoglycan/LPS O-acetylase OafA/YrhL